MSSKAFTLIELLAVIVILSIIALIAVPIVLNIINDSKKSSNEESIKMYGKAIENAAGNYFLKHPEKKKVTVQELKNENLINYDGTQVECAVEKIYKSGKIYLKDCTVGGTKVDYTYGEESYKDYIHLVEDAEPIGLSPGDKYTYDVNDNDTFYFYILSIEENQVNLIMDRNICNSGKPADKDHQCNYRWYSQAIDNTYGPVTIMNELYKGTKAWDNVPKMELNFKDAANSEEDGKGYTNFAVSDGIGTIIGKPTTNVTTLGTTEEPLRSRLPKENEVIAVGCIQSTNWVWGTCPAWLVENTVYYNASNDKYSINKNNGLTNIYGYRLLDTASGSNTSSYVVHACGQVAAVNVGFVSYGARPVITVPLSNF